jgi:hypothetical protein
MAIVVDTHSDKTYDSSNVTSATLSHTTASGCNLLVVSVATRSCTVTGVTYAGVAMTLAIEDNYDTPDCSIWYLANPTVGANNIVASFSTGIGRYAMSGVSLFGAKALPNITGSAEGTATSSSVTFTTTVPGCIGVDAQYNAGTIAGTAGAGQTLMADYDGNDGAGTSYKTGLSVGSNSMSWTSFSGSEVFVHVVAAFAPSGKPKVMVFN